MKCFIHRQEEDVSACRTCGKGMCSNCSAYTNHSGICPACKKVELEKTLRESLQCRDSLDKEKGWYIFKTIIFCWTIIYLFYGLYKIASTSAEIEKTDKNIDFLNGEIHKINVALTQGEAKI